MKTKLDRDQDAPPSERQHAFVIETDEDCQVAQDRLDTISASAHETDAGNEIRALRSAIETWHHRKRC